MLQAIHYQGTIPLASKVLANLSMQAAMFCGMSTSQAADIVSSLFP